MIIRRTGTGCRGKFWSDMIWMHERWLGMAWMHTGMMGGLDPGGMMGQ